MLGDQPGVTAGDGRGAARRPRRRAAGRVPLRRRARAPDRLRARASSASSPACTATRASGGCSTGAPPRSAEVRDRRCRSRSTSTPDDDYRAGARRAASAVMSRGARSPARPPTRCAGSLPDIETLARRLGRGRLPRRRGPGDVAVPGAAPAAAAAARGRGGRRQDRGGQGAGGRARHAAHAPAVLRGHRRRRGALRVELPAPAAQHPARRRERRDAARGGPVRPDYLIRRPLLRALEHPGPRPAVLLIDEIDRADDDFEAFLLELLAEASVTIPEIGTITATHPPIIVLTSNRTRDLHDAVKRRCLYHWIDYPSAGARGRDRAPAGEGLVADARGRRSRTPSRACATATCRSRRGSPRRSTGSRRCELLGVERLDAAAVGSHARVGAQVRRGPGGRPRGRPRAARGQR